MTMNPYADQQLIVDKLKTLPQPITEGVDDVQLMSRSTDGRIKPFIDIEFGVLTASVRGRTFDAESAQPHDTYIFVTVYGPSRKIVRQIHGMLMEPGFFLDWSPSINSSDLAAGGGIPAQINDDTRPTIYYQRQTFRFTVNLAAQH